MPEHARTADSNSLTSRAGDRRLPFPLAEPPARHDEEHQRATRKASRALISVLAAAGRAWVRTAQAARNRTHGPAGQQRRLFSKAQVQRIRESAQRGWV